MQLPNLNMHVFHREGGLDLTRRFKDDEWPIIEGADWKDRSEPVQIAFNSGSQLESHVMVREFVPRDGDATGRFVTDARGAHQWIELPPYAIINPMTYLSFFRTSVQLGAMQWASQGGPVHLEAVNLLNANLAPEMQLLLNYDFARYQKTQSAYLTGTNKLGISPLPADGQTTPGESPLPRMITAQCDAVSTMYLAELLTVLFGEANGSLARRLRSAEPMDTHIGYVAIRLIVQGTLYILADKIRRSKQNSTADHSLECLLQNNMSDLIASFARAHRGVVYDDVVKRLSAESVAFHTSMDDEKANGLGQSQMQTLYWLPTLSDMLSEGYTYQFKELELDH